MFKWFLAIFLGLALFSAALPWLNKLGVGRLPGDFRFKLFGKEFHLPFTSTILLSFVIVLIGRFV
jgi:Protein of unknown function (DUF2905)